MSNLSLQENEELANIVLDVIEVISAAHTELRTTQLALSYLVTDQKELARTELQALGNSNFSQSFDKLIKDLRSSLGLNDKNAGQSNG